MTVHSVTSALAHQVDPIKVDQECFAFCGRRLVDEGPLVLRFNVDTASQGMWLHASCAARFAESLLRDAIRAMDYPPGPRR